MGRARFELLLALTLRLLLLQRLLTPCELILAGRAHAVHRLVLLLLLVVVLLLRRRRLHPALRQHLLELILVLAAPRLGRILLPLLVRSGAVAPFLRLGSLAPLLLTQNLLRG